MIDWITAAVEAVGIAIFCVWVVVPIREFRGILRRLADPKNEEAGRGPTP